MNNTDPAIVDTNMVTSTLAKENYRDALIDSTPPETAVEQIRARKAGYVTNAGAEDLADFHAEDINWKRGAVNAVAYQKRMADDFAFTNFLKNDVSRATAFESAFYNIVGDGGKVTSLWKSIRNSLGRSGFEYANTAPLFGNIRQLDESGKRLTALRSALEAVESGNKEYFATEADPSGQSRFDFIKAYGPEFLAYLEAEHRRLAEDVAANRQQSAGYETSEAFRKISEAKTIGEAVSAFLSSPLQASADFMPGMLLQMIPGIAAAGLTGGVAGLPVAAITQGLYSMGLDYNATALGFLEEHGITGEDVADVFANPSSPIYQAMQKEALAHSAPVGAFDALSMLAIVGRLGRRLPASVAKVAPSAARRYETFMASPYRRAAANIVAQSQLQGAMGASGEALGQVAQKGEVYSPSDVFLEWIGEFATAPFESVAATVSAREELIYENIRTFNLRRELKEEVIPAAQESTSLKLGPEIHKEVLDEVTKDSPYKFLYCDLDGLTDEEKDTLSQVSPAFAAARAEAEATGSDLKISYADFVTQIAPTDQANAFADNAHVEGEMSQAELNLIEKNTLTDLNQQLLISQNSDFVKSASVVADEIKEMMKDIPVVRTRGGEPGAMTASEKTANAKLVLHHVVTIARDTGMSPEDVWHQFGMTGVLSERAGQFTKGALGDAVLPELNPQAYKAALEKQSNAWAKKVDTLDFENPGKEAVKMLDDTPMVFRILNARYPDGLWIDFYHYVNVKKGKQKHPENTKEFLKALPVLLADPIAIFDDKKNPDRKIALLEYKTASGASMLAVVDFKRLKKAGKSQAVGVITTFAKTKTVDGKEIASNEYFERGVNENRLRYLDTKKAASWASDSGIDLLDAATRPGLRTNALPPGSKASEPIVLTEEDLSRARAKDPGFFQDSGIVNWLGAFAPDLRKMFLSAASNRSTFLHETGHWFMGARVMTALRLKNIEGLTDAQARFVRLTEDAVKWASGKTLEEFSAMSVDERRAAEEKFARAYEAYLYEGRAPTQSLLSLFRRFSSWLIDVYRSLGGVPGVEMSEEVRVLFDGLFVSSEEAKQALVMRGIYRMMDTLEDGVEAGYDAVADAVNEAYAEIEADVRERLLARFMRDTVHLRNLQANTIKKLTQEGERYRKEYAEDAARHLLLTSPVERLVVALTDGELKVRIAMPEGVTKKRIGDLTVFSTPKEAQSKGYVLLEPEQAANAYGFSSFDELVQGLTNRVPLEEQVAAEVEERMLREHGELSTAEKIARVADEAIYSDASVAALSNELNALEKASGSRISNRMIFGPIVERIVGNTRIKDLRERTAITNATKAANKAYEALTRKGAKDTVVAARFKREQVYHTMLAAAISNKRSRIAKRIKALRKHYFNGKVRDTFPTAYLEQIETLMHAYGLAPEPKGAARQSYADFVASEQAAGRVEPPALPDAPAGVDPNERTVRDTEEILDFLEVLAATGRASMQIEVEGKKRELAEIDDEISSAITASAEKRGISAKENGRREGVRAKSIDTLKRIVAEHWRGPQALEVIEGKRFGAFWKYLVKPFDEAGTREASLRSQKAKELDEALKPLQPLLNSHKLKFRRHLDGSFSDAQMVAIALNMNSLENIARLIEGSNMYKGREGKEKWSLDDIVAEVQETLTSEQLSALQKTWNVVGSLWNDVVALEYATNHRKPKGVEGYKQTLIGKDGRVVDLQGGYYPIKYDPSISVMSSAELNALNERGVSALALMVGESKKTGQGHVMERVQSAPKEHALELTIVPAFTGLKSIIHDLCWRQPLENAWKVLGQRTKTAKAIRTYFGNEQYQALDKWLKGIANDGATVDSVGDGVARVLRSGLSVAALGFNLVTAAIQLTGMAQTISVLGPKWSGIGALEFLTNPMASRRFVYEHSTMMQQRVQTQFRELGEVHAALVANRSKALERIQTYAYAPIVIVQTMVDIPTWLGAYQQELSNGATETEAAARADRVVVETQGSGRLQDLSVIENGNAWLKLATVFYTFFNSTLNLARIHARNEQGLKRFGALLMVLALQPIAEQMLRGLLTRGDEDDDDDEWATAAKYAKSVVSFNLGLGVGLREFAGGLEGFGYKGPTGFRKVGDTINAFNQLTKMLENGEVDEAGAKAVITAIGEWTGLPYVMVNRLLSGANAYYIDEETDDWLALLLGFKRK